MSAEMTTTMDDTEANSWLVARIRARMKDGMAPENAARLIVSQIDDIDELRRLAIPYAIQIAHSVVAPQREPIVVTLATSPTSTPASRITQTPEELIERAGRHLKRRETQRVEISVIPRYASEPFDPMILRDALLEEHFTLRGDTIRWLDATPQQHEDRAQWLENMAKGNMETARRHRWAAATIRRENVRNLAELAERAEKNQ